MTEPSESSRRDFLSGKSAVQAIGDALHSPRAALPPPASVGVEPGSHLLSVSREAMACLFEVVMDAAAYRDKTEVAVAALERVALIEDQLTVYRDTSEVAQLNRQAAAAAIAVEPGLFQLLKRAAALSAATAGAFEITAGRLTKVWGFFRRQGRMPSPEEVSAALATVGSQYLSLADSQQTVTFTRPGLELNLGAIGKGYALDCAASTLVAGGVRDFLIHGGNSSVLARGRRDHSECRLQNLEREGQAAAAAPGWTVGLRHPLKPAVRLAEFVLGDQALGTSGSGTQYFHYQGRRYGHILDPRSGWPAEQVLSATVIAPSAELADALSTAFYVLGIEPARQFCEGHPEIAALLVTPTNSASSIELTAINLPDERWRRL